MTRISDAVDITELHSINIAEALAEERQWEYDRVTEDQIALAVEGQWRTYSITLAWSPQDETPRLIGTFEMEPPEEHLGEFYDLINLVNDMVWTGAFIYWDKQKIMVWRYGLLLSGEQIASAQQVDDMIASAIMSCERFYPAFQLVGWGNCNATRALQSAISDARGHA